MESLKDRLKQEIEYNEVVLSILEIYPKLHEEATRWSKYLATPEINSECDDAVFTHSCGCCDDAVLYVMPYKEVNGIKIFSSPTQIVIGERCGSGDREYMDWEHELNSQDIPQIIVDKVRAYFKDNEPTYDDVEEDV